VSTPEPKVPWWKEAWARRMAAVALPAIIAVTCPLLPWPAAQVVCKGVGHVVSAVANDSSPSGGASAPIPPGAECVENAVQSVPSFCRCRGGKWTDYFDAGTCAP
jgi:hypothetical protein